MKLLICLFILQAAIANLFGQVSFGEATKINDGWRFHKGDIENASAIDFKDSVWRQLNLPHDWSIEATLSPDQASSSGYLPGGIGWYRKSIDIPLDMKTKKVFIYFEGVYRNGEVFINGTSVGMRPNGFISYMYELTPYIKFGDKNVIAVKVDHSESADSRYYTGSGIYRDVYLIYANPVHIDLWGVYYTTPEISSKHAKVHVQTAIKNTTKQNVKLIIVQEILDKSNNIVAKVSGIIHVSSEKTDTANLDLLIKQPHLWSINDPYLYKVSTTVFEGKNLIDKTIGNIGIRSFAFDANKGFYLNGQSMKIKGVCLHDDAGCLGVAVPKEVWERRLITLKSIGCNAIRTSHNPHDPILYDLCDELGFLVMDEPFDEWEFPKNKWIDGWNVGIPGHEGTSEYFKKWGDTDLCDMVLRDRNHPSVFMWSVGNEVDYPNDPYSHPILDKESIEQHQYQQGYLPDHPNAERIGIIAKRLVSVIKTYDKSRPVTGALAGPIMSNETDYPGVLDVVGYNYTERRYAQDHAKYPKRIFYGSENRQDYNAWEYVEKNDYIFGQFLWTGIDYLGESFRWPSRGFNSGLLDLAGFKKSIGYFRESLWSNEPMVYIGTFPNKENWENFYYNADPVWNFNNGDTIRVVCFTNCASAQLKLNGKTVGETKEYNHETGVIYWDIPYQSGKLEVFGYKLNQVVAHYSIETSKQPYAIAAKAYSKTISLNKGVAQIEIQIVDEDGKPVFLADNEITCLLDGPVKLLGLESGNTTDMGDYRDNKQRVYHGKLIAYIQSTGKQGKASVTFKSPWLVETKVNIEIHE
jgi:hypothetical protein